MQLERTKNAKRNILFGFIQKIIGMILPFLLRTVMIYVLGIQYLGINTLFASILSVLSLAELGFGSAMIYAMYKPIAEDDEKTICALLNFYKKCYRVIGLVILAVGLVTTPFITYFIKDSSYPSDINIYVVYLISLVSTVITYFLFAYKASLLTAFQRTDVSSKIGIVVSVLQYAVQIVLLLIFKNYYIYLIVAPIFSVVTNLWTAYVVTRMYPEYRAEGKLSKELLDNIKDKVKSLFIYKIGNVVSNSVDNIVISAFLGVSMLAVYGNYYYIISALFGFLALYYSSISGGLGNGIARDSVENNYILFKKLFIIQIWMIGWMSICLLCLYQPFMKIWVGDQLLLPFGAVACMAIYFYSWKINDIVAIFKEAAGMWSQDRWRPLTASTFNLLLNVVLVQHIGIYGVIISTIATELFFSTTWSCYVLFKYYFGKSIFEYYKTLFGYTAVTIGIAVLTYKVCSFIPYTGYFELVCKLMVCCIVPNIVYLAVFCFTKKDKIIIEMLRKVMRG